METTNNKFNATNFLLISFSQGATMLPFFMKIYEHMEDMNNCRCTCFKIFKILRLFYEFSVHPYDHFVSLESNVLNSGAKFFYGLYYLKILSSIIILQMLAEFVIFLYHIPINPLPFCFFLCVYEVSQ